MILRQLFVSRSGSSAAEFALVLPLLLLLMFGIIDGGRYLWTVNRAEKAVQMGVRMAVVTNFVSSDLDASYLGECSPALTQGDSIPEGCFSQIVCSKTGAAASCTSGTANNTAFVNVADRMRLFMPEIEDSDIQIIYSDSGLGYAGDPNGPDVAPLTTVQLSGMTFEPIVTLGLMEAGIPQIHSSLTFEDGAGAQSN